MKTEKITAEQRRMMNITIGKLIENGAPIESVVIGRPWTRSYACAGAFRHPACPKFDVNKCNGIVVRSFDLDWMRVPGTGELVRLRIVVCGYRTEPVATAEMRMRSKLLRSAKTMWRWGEGDLP